MLYKYSSRIISSLKPRGAASNFDSAEIHQEQPAELQGNNQDYQKFVVLGHQRSGSSLVITSLREHPQMVVFSELFVPDSIFFHLQGYNNQSEKLRDFRDAQPTQFLDEFIFSPYNDQIKAVGFKLFPDQIDRFEFRSVWKWLARHRDLKIIYLTRRNLLATYTSLLIAQKDNKYAIKDQSQRSKSTVRIDPATCRREFRKRMRYEAALEKYIQRQEVMRWYYEDLAAAPQEQLKLAQQFLGVEVQDLPLKLVKQELRPLHEVIENYDELREYFTGTEWEYLFHDPSDTTQPQTVSRPHARQATVAGKTRKFFRRPAIAGGALAASLLFVGLFLSQLFASKTDAKEQTVTVIGQVAARITGYVDEHRELPKALEALSASGPRPHAMDAWNRPLDYSVVGSDTFTLTSYGSDGVPGGTGDGSDIVCTYRLAGDPMRDLQ